MRELGIEASHVGLILGLMVLGEFTMEFFVGFIADRFNISYKRILIAVLIGVGAINLLLLLIPPYKPCDTGYLTCQDELLLLESESINCNTGCEDIDKLICNEVEQHATGCVICLTTSKGSDNCHGATFQLVNVHYQGNHSVLPQYKCRSNCSHHNCIISENDCQEDGGNYALTVGVYTILQVICRAPVSSVYGMLHATLYASNVDFGVARGIGILGSVIAVLISGIIQDITSDVTGIDYSFGFYAFAGACVITALISLPLKVPNQKRAKGLWSQLYQMGIDPEAGVYLAVVLYTGICFGFKEGFVFWYLQDIGASQTILSLTYVATALAGIPLLMFSRYLIEKLGMLCWTTIYFLQYVMYFVGISFITNPPVVFIIEVFEALGYVGWVAQLNRANYIAPRGMTATVVSLVDGLHYSIGRGIGGVTGGLLYDAYGGKQAFFWWGIMTFIFGTLYFIFQVTYNKRTSKVKKGENTSSGDFVQENKVVTVPEKLKGQDDQKCNLREEAKIDSRPFTISAQNNTIDESSTRL